MKQDSIVAIATSPGRGGVGIVRISGPAVTEVAQRVLKQLPTVRMASYLPFYDATGQQLDQGIALLFRGPHSFTGEDVLELQGHGGPVVLDLLVKAALACPSVRLARPGEFSERAFLNDKLDLAQAEAIADLIEAASETAARLALASLNGAFSERINQLVEALIHLRIFVEAAIDFPDEEIDFLSDGKIEAELNRVMQQLQQVRREARQGALVRDGMQVVIAGKPNAGKSSLLNALAGRDTAIVTDIPGTTRDLLREQIQINGMPLHIIDTAGLREASDRVEQIGIERAWQAIREADRLLLVQDASCETLAQAQAWLQQHANELPRQVTLIRNKRDLAGLEAGLTEVEGLTELRLTTKNPQDIDLLRQHLLQAMGFQQGGEGGFIARRRHLDALERADAHLHQGQYQLLEQRAGELLAEELRLAQQALSEITGQFSSDDLLGRIFSSFCIGK
jgi:tRNA modification GTPase